MLLDHYPATFALTVLYLLIVWMGPKYMKHRQPYSCRGAMMIYNLGLTLLSFYMFYEVNGGLRPSYCSRAEMCLLLGSWHGRLETNQNHATQCLQRGTEKFCFVGPSAFVWKGAKTVEAAERSQGTDASPAGLNKRGFAALCDIIKERLTATAFSRYLPVSVANKAGEAADRQAHIVTCKVTFFL